MSNVRRHPIHHMSFAAPTNATALKLKCTLPGASAMKSLALTRFGVLSQFLASRVSFPRYFDQSPPTWASSVWCHGRPGCNVGRKQRRSRLIQFAKRLRVPHTSSLALPQVLSPGGSWSTTFYTATNEPEKEVLACSRSTQDAEEAHFFGRLASDA
jgi:hypothetical protein